MEDTKFLELWNNTVKPLLNWKLSDDDRLYAMYDIEALDACNGMKAKYDALRKEIKDDFMEKSHRLLDRHKICACICMAIIERPILKVTNGTTKKDILVNTWVAFLASCRILYSFMLDDAKSDPGFEKFLRENKILHFPECKNIDSDESYLIQTIKYIYYAKSQNKLNVLALSNVFCLLEDRTCLVYKETKSNKFP